MQVVLKIYVYYNDKLFFGIFHSGFISIIYLVWVALQNVELYTTNYIACMIMIMLTIAQQSV